MLAFFVIILAVILFGVRVLGRLFLAHGAWHHLLVFALNGAVVSGVRRFTGPKRIADRRAGRMASKRKGVGREQSLPPPPSKIITRGGHSAHLVAAKGRGW
jgi:hypothetical protein